MPRGSLDGLAGCLRAPSGSLDGLAECLRAPSGNLGRVAVAERTRRHGRAPGRPPRRATGASLRSAPATRPGHPTGGTLAGLAGSLVTRFRELSREGGGLPTPHRSRHGLGSLGRPPERVRLIPSPGRPRSLSIPLDGRSTTYPGAPGPRRDPPVAPRRPVTYPGEA